MPWPFDLIGGTVRYVLGAPARAESEVEDAEAVLEPRELEAKLDEVLAVIRGASASLERHVEVLGALSDSLPALTESVTRLTDQLDRVMKVTEPFDVAEREASRLDRILRRRAQSPEPPAEQPQPEQPQPEQPQP